MTGFLFLVFIICAPLLVLVLSHLFNRLDELEIEVARLSARFSVGEEEGDER